MTRSKRLNLTVLVLSALVGLVGLMWFSAGFVAGSGRIKQVTGLCMIVTAYLGASWVLLNALEVWDEWCAELGVNQPEPIDSPAQSPATTVIEATDTDTETGTTAHAVVSQLL